MRTDIILRSGWLRQFTDHPEYSILVIGTGAFARDMQRKLRLLGLDVPLLIGNITDPERGILHYNELATLGDPDRYRFIMACDLEEADMIPPAHMAAYRFLLPAPAVIPRILNEFKYPIERERSGRECIDAANGRVILPDSGKPVAVFGSRDDRSAFHIHILGGCQVSGVNHGTGRSFGEQLQEKLAALGFHAVVYSWDQANYGAEEHLMTYLRDVATEKRDLVIMAKGLLGPLLYIEQNALAARNGMAHGTRRLMVYLQDVRKETPGNGGSYPVSPLAIRETQHRVMSALSRLHGFAFWDIIPPDSKLLPEKLASQLKNNPPRYRARRRAEKEELLNVIGKEHIRDYTDCFSEHGDIYDYYTDAVHFSDHGNSLLAARCASEIVSEFSQREKEQ